jgi:hypothetical protein
MRSHTLASWPAMLAITASAALLSGCGGQRQDEARAAASDFYAAVSRTDGAAACALLAPATREELEQSSGKPCERAVVEEVHGDVGEGRSSHAFGTMAEVAFADDTVFLTSTPDGWRVLAAACTPRAGGQPYDCRVKGG